MIWMSIKSMEIIYEEEYLRKSFIVFLSNNYPKYLFARIISVNYKIWYNY